MKDMRQVVQEIRALMREPLYVQVLKYSETQLRHPKGKGRESGRFAKGGGVRGQALADVSPKHREFPDPISTDNTLPHKNLSGTRDWRWPSNVSSPATGMVRGGGSAGWSTKERLLSGPQKPIRNKPRRGAGMPEPPPPTAPHPSPEQLEVESGLKSGHISDSSDMGDGLNGSRHVELDNGLGAVYKPEAAEQWGLDFNNDDIQTYITNRQFSLGEREAFVYEAGEGLFGEHNPVPVTILKENVETESGPPSGGGASSGTSASSFQPDSADLKRQYDEYVVRAEAAAVRAIDQEMKFRYQGAQVNHYRHLQHRAEEMGKIWNELVDEERLTPDEVMAIISHPVLPLGESQIPFNRNPYPPGNILRHPGLEAALAEQEHPMLPIVGPIPGFQRKEFPDVIDPIDILDRAGVKDVSVRLTPEDKENVKALLRKEIQDGVRVFGIVGEREGYDHLDEAKWYERNKDLREELAAGEVQSFSLWKKNQQTPRTPSSYTPSSGYGGNVMNDEAPHPNGGSLQHFIPADGDQGDMQGENGVRMAVLDYVVGTMDRHHRNIMGHQGRPVAIDNGYSMPEITDDSFTFRSISVGQWMTGDGNVSEEQRQTISAALEATDWKALVDRHPSMAVAEREGFLNRIKRMKEAMQTERGLIELWESLNLKKR